jgi:hypothetical protein
MGVGLGLKSEFGGRDQESYTPADVEGKRSVIIVVALKDCSERVWGEN